MSSSKPLILVVDDEAPIRSALCRIVARQGCIALEASSAAEALALVGVGQEPAGAICDYNMPGSTGVELARELREMFPELPILLLSGGIYDPDIGQAMESGDLWAYVAKPWSLSWMKEAIGAMVRGEGPPP